MCPQAKSHQFLYLNSTGFSSHPLKLVLWGSAPESIGRFKYYVNFIDDFSKFTWIYLVKHNYEIFRTFQEFQTLV
jgi:hypothetical protein